MLNLSVHCPHINELFTETFVQMHVLRRIKYYQLPCQKYSSNLSCFYDDLHICLCYDYGQQRLANCFDFNHNMKLDCFCQCNREWSGRYCTIEHTCMCSSNSISVILITAKSRQKSNLQTNQSFLTLLKEQIRQHKNLFTAPILLIILALPRLILLFVAKCMKSTNDTWLLLIGYFISFIPPMLTFIVFILPSKFDKQQLHKSLVACRTRV
ncbi:unnamed protein product [Rotaria sp. Silwood1]|nr:unnamed protein product [Rotaria sp. Silwood1]